jgi:predicted component of type VI protein secretion system
MSPLIAVAADLLVGCLLVATIATSVRLSRRLAAMKAGEDTMRATIAELVTATEKADAAIAGLRATVLDSERALADRLGAAARHTERLSKEVMAGEAVIERVSKIAAISRRLSSEEAARSAPSAAGPLVEPVREPPPSRAEDGLRAAIRLARDVAEGRIGGRAA